MVEYAPFNLPVVDTDGEPEAAQGVYRQQTLGFPDGTLALNTIILGYLVQAWSKLCHTGPLTQVQFLPGITGSGSFDFSEHKKVWEVHLVTIDILQKPESTNIDFGSPNFVYVGKGAFLRSAFAVTQNDWNLDPGINISGGFSGVVTLNTPQLATQGMLQPQSFAPIGAGFTPLTEGAAPNGSWNTQLQNGGGTFQAAGAVTWGFQKKSTPLKLNGVVQLNDPYFYPVEWINYDRSVFRTPDDMANGFMWSFKPGVTANIRIWGRPHDPYVSAGGGEGPGALWNPMKGGG